MEKRLHLPLAYPGPVHVAGGIIIKDYRITAPLYLVKIGDDSSQHPPRVELNNHNTPYRSTKILPISREALKIKQPPCLPTSRHPLLVTELKYQTAAPHQGKIHHHHPPLVESKNVYSGNPQKHKKELPAVSLPAPGPRSGQCR